MSGWPSYSTLFWVAVTLLNLFALARAITRGHGVESTLAWVCAILAFPGLGAGAYLLLANPSVKRASRRKRLTSRAVRRLVRRVRNGSGGPGGAGGEAVKGLAEDERPLLHLAASVTGLAPTGGNRVRLLTENDRAFESIERAIQEARRSIWAEFYLIRNDETGRLFLDLLARRAREGLEVRLLYDAFGSFWLDAGLLREIRRAGGRAEAFLPLNPLRRRWAIHLRNHRKMVIADGEAGFTGGMNMGDEYSGRALRRRDSRLFRDTHLELSGPAVADLAQIFAEDWSFATGEELRPPPPPAPPPDAGSVVAVLPSGPDQDHNASGLVYFSAIASARRYCYVTSPYFIPDAGTARALVSAALRGVDVRVLVPGRSDVALVGPAARSFYPQLVTAGVRVFEYQPRMLHAKTMAVDGAFSVVGSANVDMRSFRLNFEVGALILDRAFARDLEGRFLADLGESVEIRREAIERRSLLVRFQQSAARLLSPIL